MQDHKHKQFTFNIVGDAVANDPRSLHYYKLLKKLIAILKLQTVHLTAAVKEPWTIMGNNDLILSLGNEEESFGRVVIEGLAMGKIVVVFDAMGPGQIMRQYVKYLHANGLDIEAKMFLVEVNNAKLLAQVINKWALMPSSKLAQITSLGRNFVTQHYNLTENTKRLYDILTYQG